jgi:uncharacterized protein YndB with AHSA1/START domain
MRVAIALLAAVLLLASAAGAAPKSVTVNAFSFELPVTLPGTPEDIFAAATGDISGWWDHTFSQKPKALVLEPKVGGHFLELFDDHGNGAQHAEVIYCDRPKKIRFEGPLGLSGTALNLVCTYSFEATGADSTRMTLSVSGAGAVDAATGPLVEGVWRHFLIERFKPYILAGKHKVRK